MLLQTTNSSPLSHSLNSRRKNLSLQDIFHPCSATILMSSRAGRGLNVTRVCNLQIHRRELAKDSYSLEKFENSLRKLLTIEENLVVKRLITQASALSFGSSSWLISAQVANAGENVRTDAIYEVGELFELGIQLSYLLLLLGLLGLGTFFVIRQVLVRRELDLSAKELQEQVRSGDASATELFELGAVMLRRKFYPAATKYLLQAIEKWDGDDQDSPSHSICLLPFICLALICNILLGIFCPTVLKLGLLIIVMVYNALGVSYVRDGKLEKGITQFETAVKLQPGYVTAWNNLGDAYEKKKDLKLALKAFEEVLLFDPNNKVARPRRDALKDRVKLYKGVPVKSKER
ncbi:hypothetical protein Patl1_07856 [Pistacia atlantica]|uniref:Uncharacterized protein n=1 Tax=Pistacia atlantica TaxID=434234 RepID=A0ACC1AIY4_9ROSI|nr:hypothetical protein Patl1_07856 [Pistacia atlantica]